MSKGVNIELINESKAALKKANVLFWFLLATVVFTIALAIVTKSTGFGLVAGFGGICVAYLHRRLTYTAYLIKAAEEVNSLIAMLGANKVTLDKQTEDLKKELNDGRPS